VACHSRPSREVLFSEMSLLVSAVRNVDASEVDVLTDCRETAVILTQYLAQVTVGKDVRVVFPYLGTSGTLRKTRWGSCCVSTESFNQSGLLEFLRTVDGHPFIWTGRTEETLAYRTYWETCTNEGYVFVSSNPIVLSVGYGDDMVRVSSEHITRGEYDRMWGGPLMPLVKISSGGVCSPRIMDSLIWMRGDRLQNMLSVEYNSDFVTRVLDVDSDHIMIGISQPGYSRSDLRRILVQGQVVLRAFSPDPHKTFKSTISMAELTDGALESQVFSSVMAHEVVFVYNRASVAVPRRLARQSLAFFLVDLIAQKVLGVHCFRNARFDPYTFKKGVDTCVAEVAALRMMGLHMDPYSMSANVIRPIGYKWEQGGPHPVPSGESTVRVESAARVPLLLMEDPLVLENDFRPRSFYNFLHMYVRRLVKDVLIRRVFRKRYTKTNFLLMFSRTDCLHLNGCGCILYAEGRSLYTIGWKARVEASTWTLYAKGLIDDLRGYLSLM